MANEAQILVRLLRQHGKGRWVTKRMLAGWMGTEMELHHRFDPRQVAEAASQTGGEVVCTGKGYKLFDDASDKEILEGYGCLMRKSIATGERAKELVSYARRHGRLRNETEIEAERRRAEEAVRKVVSYGEQVGRKEEVAAAAAPAAGVTKPVERKPVALEQLDLFGGEGSVVSRRH